MKHPVSDKKSLSSTAWLLLALAAAVALGLLSHLLPEEARSSLSTGLISPFNSTFMGLLSAIAAPVIFLSILCSICNIGDIKALGKIGTRTILRIILVPLLLALIILMVMLPFYSISRENGVQVDGAALLNLLLDIAPDNFLAPFTEGNFLQIIFLSVVLGTALLVLDQKVSSLTKGLQQLRLVINKLMQWITRLIPLFVFGVIFDLMLSNSFHTLISYYKVFLICMLAFTVLISLYLIRVSLHKHIPLILLIKKLLPTFLIALTTASSTAALPTTRPPMMETVCPTALGRCRPASCSSSKAMSRPSTSITALLPNDVDLSTFSRSIVINSQQTGEELVAPVAAGQILGEITVSRDGVVYGSTSLVASTGVELSRAQYMKGQLLETLRLPAVIITFWILVVLIGLYLLLVVRYRAKRRAYMRRLANARLAHIDLEDEDEEDEVFETRPQPQPSRDKSATRPIRKPKTKKPMYMEPEPVEEEDEAEEEAPTRVSPVLAEEEDENVRDYFEEFFGSNKDNKRK